ncbi:hypothetical protein [Algoriphagus taiwanensis]|uniref:Uncharacterized protein n=1 Tax=Algoriphagus taiwanensis TaxID=1445656 RepID=A0ABQ6Q551_9BACT|nr:hypothetical protein Ataiwa_32690 [Algoriphagus taiwanensis]
MKKLFFLLLVFSGLFFTSHGQNLNFVNIKSTQNIPRFEVKNNQTTLYHMVGGRPVVMQTWNQVPQFFNDEDRINRYKMTVSREDKLARRTYEVWYSFSRDAQAYDGYVKTTIRYKDSRPSKVFEDYFIHRPLTN